MKKEEVEDEEEEEEETETSSESSDEESDEDSEDAKPKTPASKGMEKTDIGPLLARSAQARDNGSGGSNNSSRRPSQDESYTRSRYVQRSTFRDKIMLVAFLFLDTVLAAINHRRRTKVPGKPTPQQVVVST